ncbi:hypothetical protein GHT09_002090 [Marmota monax]|uniref:Kinesin motor domain-containing protein n=1 Tax=Marmota monax TaxID=9995 RepID=A0A834PWE4_MARMO|nr:hypothetical protein GHT09_002090 [Marmota monax]
MHWPIDVPWRLPEQGGRMCRGRSSREDAPGGITAWLPADRAGSSQIATWSLLLQLGWAGLILGGSGMRCKWPFTCHLQGPGDIPVALEELQRGNQEPHGQIGDQSEPSGFLGISDPNLGGRRLWPDLFLLPQLKEHPEKGVYVKGLSLHTVHSVAQCERIMETGWKNRSVGYTLMNKDSSRSHSIFTISIEIYAVGMWRGGGREAEHLSQVPAPAGPSTSLRSPPAPRETGKRCPDPDPDRGEQPVPPAGPLLPG